MLNHLDPSALGAPKPVFFCNNRDFRGTDWQASKIEWMRDQWAWSVAQPVDWHLFLTDDLHLMPRFWEALDAMTRVVPGIPIGLLSNHPAAVSLAREGIPGYRTNSWLVGPAYALPHAFLRDFFEWWLKLPDQGNKPSKSHFNDDSAINEFVSQTGSSTWHPVPTIIEHRDDVESTVGHGDKFSRERVSWRSERSTHITLAGGLTWNSVRRFEFAKDPDAYVASLCAPSFWGNPAQAPLLKVGE
jgi:hypothetical protein